MLIAATRARVILPAAAGVWTAAELAHLGHVNDAEMALGAFAVTACTAASRYRPFAGTAGAIGAWATLAVRYGPLAAPGWWCPLTITWAAAAIAALIVANRHSAVREAKAWRAARRALAGEAHVLGIHGAHLLEHETTRLGERWVLDVNDTGKLASAIVHSGLAERLAARRRLPKSRVRVTEGGIAGRVVVSIRTKDPWKHPIPHPLFAGEPELDLPVPCTITQPFPVGQDPETGAPLNVTLWDEIGGKVVLVVAKRGAGKDVLLDCIRERVTAAYDADLWEINVSKAQNERAWAQACEYAACGPEQAKEACRILLEARRLGDERGRAHRDKTTLRPDRENRLKVIIINETDALFQLPNIDPAFVKRELRYITSKLRSEGFALVLASQRAIFNWIGGTDVKANVDLVAVGKVQNPQEANNAVGRLVGATLPDMSTYGEGKPGVWCIVADGGSYEIGRTFELPANGDLDILRDLAHERAYRVPVLAGIGAETLPASNLPAGNPSPSEPPAQPSPVPPSGGEPPPGDAFDRWVTEGTRDLPQDLRDRLAKITKKQAETRAILEELPEITPLSPEDQKQRAKINREKWRQAGEQAVIPDDQRGQLLDLLTHGTTIKEVSEHFKISIWTARTWLEKLRDHEPPLAECRGKGRGARWHRPETTAGDDAPCT